MKVLGKRFQLEDVENFIEKSAPTYSCKLVLCYSEELNRDALFAFLFGDSNISVLEGVKEDIKSLPGFVFCY